MKMFFRILMLGLLEGLEDLPACEYGLHPGCGATSRGDASVHGRRQADRYVHHELDVFSCLRTLCRPLLLHVPILPRRMSRWMPISSSRMRPTPCLSLTWKGKASRQTTRSTTCGAPAPTGCGTNPSRASSALKNRAIFPPPCAR